MEKDFEKRFISPEKFNQAIRNDKFNFNCLAFAFGETEYCEFYDFSLDNILYPNICNAFIKKANFFRIGIEKVNSIEELKDCYGFILFGWTFYPSNGFHVARIEPNGQIVTKYGYKENAGYATMQELSKLYFYEPVYFFKFTGEHLNV